MSVLLRAWMWKPGWGRLTLAGVSRWYLLTCPNITCSCSWRCSTGSWVLGTGQSPWHGGSLCKLFTPPDETGMAWVAISYLILTLYSLRIFALQQFVSIWQFPILIQTSVQKAIRGYSQMTSQHWTTNGNLKSWRKLTRRDQGSSEKMMNDEKSNDSRESIQNRPWWVSLGSTEPLLEQMDGWLGVFHGLCHM